MVSIINLLYILIALLVFGLLIFIHELGHFLCARACGVGIKEFAIGMGPKLFSWNSKKYSTVYCVRLLPIGGYVSMVGEDEASDQPNSFNNQKLWKRISIVLAGPVMNILLGFLLMFALVISQKTLLGTTIRTFDSAALSSEVLCVDDKIIKVGSTRVYTFNDIVYEVMHNGNKPIDVTVIRDGKETVVEDVNFPIYVEKGVEFGKYDFLPYAEKETPSNYLKHALARSVSTVKMVLDSVVDLAKGRYGVEAISGPVGVTEVIVEAAQNSVYSLMSIVIVISINLGVFNLIPFPALDGGRLAFLLIEGITRKPIKKEVEGYVNFVGIIILLAFMAFIIVKDVFMIVGGI